MARQPAPKKQTPADRFAGKRVRVQYDAEVLSYHESGPTAPERVTLRVGGIITIAPISVVSVIEPVAKPVQEAMQW